MNVLKLARSPAPSIPRGATIRDAVKAMARTESGALVVLHEGKAAGIVSERDVVLRAVLDGLDADATPVERIMSSPVECVRGDTPTGKAIERMTAQRFRHLVICDAEDQVVGLLSSRDTFQEHLSYLFDQLLSLESFICADGPGG